MVGVVSWLALEQTNMGLLSSIMTRIIRRKIIKYSYGFCKQTKGKLFVFGDTPYLMYLCSDANIWRKCVFGVPQNIKCTLIIAVYVDIDLAIGLVV